MAGLTMLLGLLGVMWLLDKDPTRSPVPWRIDHYFYRATTHRGIRAFDYENDHVVALIYVFLECLTAPELSTNSL